MLGVSVHFVVDTILGVNGETDGLLEGNILGFELGIIKGHLEGNNVGI